MKVGLFIGTSPADVKTRFMLEFAEQCQKNAHKIEMFLFDNGLYNALDNKSLKCVTSKLSDISNNDAAINICVNMAKHRGVNESNIAEYVEISSLISFSDIMEKSDIVLTTK